MKKTRFNTAAIKPMAILSIALSLFISLVFMLVNNPVSHAQYDDSYDNGSYDDSSYSDSESYSSQDDSYDNGSYDDSSYSDSESYSSQDDSYDNGSYDDSSYSDSESYSSQDDSYDNGSYDDSSSNENYGSLDTYSSNWENTDDTQGNFSNNNSNSKESNLNYNDSDSYSSEVESVKSPQVQYSSENNNEYDENPYTAPIHDSVDLSDYGSYPNSNDSSENLSTNSVNTLNPYEYNTDYGESNESDAEGGVGGVGSWVSRIVNPSTSVCTSEVCNTSPETAKAAAETSFSDSLGELRLASVANDHETFKATIEFGNGKVINYTKELPVPSGSNSGGGGGLDDFIQKVKDDSVKNGEVVSISQAYSHPNDVVESIGIQPNSVGYPPSSTDLSFSSVLNKEFPDAKKTSVVVDAWNVWQYDTPYDSKYVSTIPIYGDGIPEGVKVPNVPKDMMVGDLERIKGNSSATQNYLNAVNNNSSGFMIKNVTSKYTFRYK